MYEFFKSLEGDKTSISYLGLFSDTLTVKLIELTDVYILKQAVMAKIRKKVSYLIAESFQNIIRHSVPENNRSKEILPFKDYFQVSMKEDRIIISSANIINNREVPPLKKKIERVNSLNQQDLKELYFNTLNDGAISEKGGASLGLIEMVRKSGSPLLKRFIKLNNEYSQFFLSIEIVIEKELGNNKTDLSNVALQYNDLLSRKAVMMYKGDFSNTSNTNLVEIVNKNITLENGLISNKVKNIIAVIELIQNVSKHGKLIGENREGMIIVSEENQDVKISCSNFIEQENYHHFKEEISEIKNSSIADLTAMYKNRLSENVLSEEGNSGLGLIELARFTKNEFTFSFHTTVNKEIFYTINLKV